MIAQECCPRECILEMDSPSKAHSNVRDDHNCFTNTSNQYEHSCSKDYLYNKFYKGYDWRPPGRDGESKRPVARHVCEPSGILSRRPQYKARTHAAGLPCRIPKVKTYSYSTPRRSLQQSPCSSRSQSRGSSCNPPSHPPPCPECPLVPSSNNVEKVHSVICSPCGTPRPSFGKHCYPRDYSAVNPCHMEQCGVRSPHSKRLPCNRMHQIAPKMDSAGISTQNYDYPFPPTLYSTVKFDCHIKHQGLYTLLGRVVKDSFEPRVGDLLITKMPRKHSSKDCGYIEFVTKKHEPEHFCPGDMLLRVGKFVMQNTWRYCKRYKLYHLCSDCRWLFVGMVDNFVNLLPVINHDSTLNHVGRHCKYFYSRRGDLILHGLVQDNGSQLEWYNPKTKIFKGDSLVRIHLGESPLQQDVVEAAVEMYRYNGKGFGWLFMGRDDCWYKDGDDTFGIECCNNNKDYNEKKSNVE